MREPVWATGAPLILHLHFTFKGEIWFPSQSYVPFSIGSALWGERRVSDLHPQTTKVSAGRHFL